MLIEWGILSHESFGINIAGFVAYPIIETSLTLLIIGLWIRFFPELYLFLIYLFLITILSKE